MKEKIKEVIDKSKTILLLAHESPDGDAIGSMVGFYHVLKSLGKSVFLKTENIPERFSFLEGIEEVNKGEALEYDLGIILDCATKERILQVDKLLDKCKMTISIDHHIKNTQFADLNYVDGNVSSCAQMLFYLFNEWKLEIDEKTAKALMMGMLTDTNGFRNNNVDEKTFLMAAMISHMGIDIYKLGKDVLYTMTKGQYQLMKIALERLEFFLDGKIAFAYITKDDMKKCQAKIGDHEGIVEMGRDIEGVEVSILIREDDGYRVSLRSSGKINVCNIALNLGGNGHEMAAGTKINKNFKDTKDLVINETIKGILLK